MGEGDVIMLLVCLPLAAVYAAVFVVWIVWAFTADPTQEGE